MTNFTALLIEGDEEKLYKIIKTIKDFDIDIIKVGTGEEALVEIYNKNIDLVLFDGDIEDMDSLEVLETILTYDRSYDIPVVLITEESKPDEFILQAYTIGISDFIKKPINYKILRAKIQVIIKSIKSKRGYERKNLILKKRILEIKEKMARLTEEKNDAEVDGNTDALTNISNRRLFDKVLEEEWFRLMRNEDNLTIFMIDIDYFKDFNDAYGHIKGDEALIEVASIIDNSFNRVGDLVARYGGEEFVVLVPNFDYEDAKEMADRLRQKIYDARIENVGSKVSPYLTVSIGVATTVPKTKYPINYIVDEADSALYLAKKSGRNIVKGIQI